jgi:hypothetical protein
VFHVSALKQAVGVRTTVSSELPVYTDKISWVLVQLLDTKTENNEILWLIQWEGFSAEEATWENAVDIGRRYPSFTA